MKITVCKEVKYKPSGITSMCSFDETIIVFRKNNTMELVRNLTYQPFFNLELPSTVIQSTMFLEKKCLVLGQDNCLRVIDLETSEVIKLNTEYSIMCFEKNYKKNTLLHCFTKNGLLISLDLKNFKEKLESKIVKKCSRTITCLLRNDENIIICDNKGQISSLDLNGNLLNESDVSKSSITSLLHISDNKYAVLCVSGELIYFDIKLHSILQKVKVREHALNCGVFMNGNLHLTGVDSRIICYKLSKESFQKSYQADKHILEATSMCTIGNTIFTGGLDGIMGIFIPTETRYVCFRVFDTTPKGKFITKGVNNNLVMINNVDFLEIFKLEEPLKNSNTLDTSYKTTVRLDKKFLEDLSVKEVKFSNECRINFESKVYCYDTDGKILVYSINKSTRLLQLTPKIENDIYFKFPSSKYICVTPEFIILHLTDRTIKIIERQDFSKFDQIISTDFDEEIKVIDSLIFFKKSKKIYDIITKCEDKELLKDVDGIIIDLLKFNEEIVILTKKDTTVHALYKKNSKNENCFHFATYDILTGIIQHNQDLYYTTNSSISNVKNGSTYDLGSIVYSSGSFENSLAVVKDDWSYLQNELGDKIIKSKWKSR